MEETLKKLNDYAANEIAQSQIAITEENGWRVDDMGNQLQIETSSPLGEDLVFYLDKNDIAHSVAELAANFDVDDHVESLIPLRGTRGVPESISDLVGDAKEIESMLYHLAEALSR